MDRLEKRYNTNLDSPHTRLEVLGLAILHQVNRLLTYQVDEINVFETGIKIAEHESSHLGQFGPNTKLESIVLTVEKKDYGIVSTCSMTLEELDPHIRLTIATVPGAEEMSDEDHAMAIKALAQLGIQITKET